MNIDWRDDTLRSSVSHHVKGIFVMGLLSTLLAACTGASAQWARQKQTTHQLDAIATVPLPQTFMPRDHQTERTPDYNAYVFQRTYKSHLNGQTSYAEDLSIYLTAPDFPRDRFDRMLSTGEFSGLGRNPGQGEPDAEGRRWIVRETMYERHPVLEPSWQVRVDDAKRGIVIVWRGFKKEYTSDAAKENLISLLAAITVSPQIADDFATRRSWSRSGWEPALAANLNAAREVLAEFKLVMPASDSLTRQGKWRMYLDDQRPQQLHLVHELASLTLPDGPFRITEPVTYFKYMQQRWVQDNQGQESDRLPQAGQQLMASELTDTARVYFYQMTAVDMWKSYQSPGEFGDLLRNTIKSMMAKHEKLLRDGFIAGDAEP